MPTLKIKEPTDLEIAAHFQKRSKELEVENRILKSDKYHAESNLEIAQDPNFIRVPKELSEDDIKTLFKGPFKNYWANPENIEWLWNHFIKHFTKEVSSKTEPTTPEGE